MQQIHILYITSINTLHSAIRFKNGQRESKKGRTTERKTPRAEGGVVGQWKEENRRGVKAGTTPQCFLSLAPRSRNIIVNISSELLAPIQTGPVQGGG